LFTIVIEFVLNKKKLMEPRTTKMHLAKLGIKHSELDF
jgi:hypothetical protein